jgi:hypothetical protein
VSFVEPPMDAMPGLTIFSAPKPFVDPHIVLIQRNATGSWLQLGAEVEVMLVGDERGIDQASRELGVRHLKGVAKNSAGTPLISSIFGRAEREGRHRLLAFVNADIVLLDDLSSTVQRVASEFDRFLIVGQRWDLEVDEELRFEPGWEKRMREDLAERGELHPPAGSDYFVFPRGLFRHIPPFALGRAGWDNWMIFAGRQMRVPVIDASPVITAIHQSHDYSHLEDGIIHHRLPESRENVRLAGGHSMVFTLADTSWCFEGGAFRRTRGDFGRWLETAAIARLGPGRRLWIVQLVFHPIKTIQSLVKRLGHRAEKLAKVQAKTQDSNKQGKRSG